MKIRFPAVMGSAVKVSVIVALVVYTSLSVANGQPRHSPAYINAARKFQWIADNGRSPRPSTRPVVIFAREWNAFLNEGGVALPDGVSNVRLSSQPAVIHGEAEVDFDRLTAGRTRNNPLLSLFTGRHHVTVIAQAAAANGIGTVRVESVAFDGVEVPRFALEYFSNRYLRPRYGSAVGMDSTFRLHSHIDAAILGRDQVTVTQR
ncbi:MAG TPA: hypothetical protein VM578_12730 [Candidatus Saccharimonadales bacterium]|nr:hypothetical protein [Candidatus Saccharimonadales bacterium]